LADNIDKQFWLMSSLKVFFDLTRYSLLNSSKQCTVYTYREKLTTTFQ